MCFSSGSNKAYEQAKADEERRRAEIAAAQNRIAQIFDSPQRSAQYADLTEAVRGVLQTELDRQFGDTSRGTKFALARSGLSGGSADIDLNARLAQDYLKNLIGVERKAQEAGSQLRAADQQTKSTLFSQILGGLGMTQAANLAANSLQSNVDIARSQALQQEVGDLFGRYTDIFKASREGAADRRAAFDFNTLYGARPRTTAPIGPYG